MEIQQRPAGVDKLYTIQKNHTDSFVKISDEIESLNGKKLLLSTKEENSGELKEDVKKRIKLIMDKLMRAHKMYPDIYGEVEKETKIFFLTPPV